MKRVLVKHSGKNGETSLAKAVVQDIKFFYVGGKVKTTSGDVWSVKPVEHRDYEYVTVAPVSR